MKEQHVTGIQSDEHFRFNQDLIFRQVGPKKKFVVQSIAIQS